MGKRKDPTLSVKLAGDVVKTARLVAVYRDEEMATMLSDILRPILERMEVDEKANRERETSQSVVQPSVAQPQRIKQKEQR